MKDTEARMETKHNAAMSGGINWLGDLCPFPPTEIHW